MKNLLFVGAALLAAGSGAAELWRPAPAGVHGAVMVTRTSERDVLFECVGHADVEAGRKMTPDTVFWMASNTKGVAAATVLSLAGEGKLGLDDPVERYFPSWSALAVTNRPTVRMLLSHTSGLPMFPSDPLERPGMAELAERAAREKLLFEPGTRYRYSNWGIDVAMAIVEKVTGRPFEVETAERIFKPLGMADTTFVLDDDRRARLAVPYRLSKDGAPTRTALPRGLVEPYDEYGRYPEAGGGLLSTPRDMIRFFGMIADGGRAPDGTVIVTEALMNAWFTDQTPETHKGRYSFGMGLHGPRRIGHSGSGGTFGEADAGTRRARVFLYNGLGSNRAFGELKGNWTKVTDLSSDAIGYASEYLAVVATPEQRRQVTEELWAHDPQAETHLWPEGKVPLKRDDKPIRFVENELWQRNVVVTDINDPFFVFYPVRKARAPVAVVLPGGGYAVLGWNKEGTEIARWLNDNGIAAAVLLYRAPDQRPAALCDVQRAIGLLRRDADRYGIDPKAVGVIGFSAGANLTAAVATNWRKRAYARVDDADDFPCRPDVQLPIYLWDVLERDPSRATVAPLLENGREPKIRAEFPVDAETPPAFLAQAKDDFCQVETTVAYFRALEKAGVVGSEMLQMAHGGHGYGRRRLGLPIDGWSEKAAVWLRRKFGLDD